MAILATITAGLKTAAAALGLANKMADRAAAADQQAAGAAKVTAADDRAAAQSLERQADAIVNAGSGRDALRERKF
jgi:hypothetical protein